MGDLKRNATNATERSLGKFASPNTNETELPRMGRSTLFVELFKNVRNANEQLQTSTLMFVDTRSVVTVRKRAILQRTNVTCLSEKLRVVTVK